MVIPPKESGYQYTDICKLLNIEPITIHDLYTEEEIKQNKWEASDIEEILKDEQPSFAELYIEYIRQPYRAKTFNTLKKLLTASELYCIIMNAISYDHFNKQYAQWEEATHEDYDVYEYFDMEFIQSYEWLDKND